ncbi:MAG: hypothetical protein M3Z06_03685 [Actinomycetota bacterium]|nr:hypothetical protein [Actinomycetota bacterium]
MLEDDELSLFSPGGLGQYVGTLRWLGIDELRISAEWKLEAPAPSSSHKPPGFRAGDPRAYDASAGVQLLDRAVRAAAAGGLGVILDPAFSAPRWATRSPRASGSAADPWYNTDIDVRQLATWEAMLALRYSGRYTPVGAGAPLPRVGTVTLWNEPNQDGYLAPQWDGGVPVSADWYRALTEIAYPAIKRASPGTTVLIGDTSSVGADAQAGNGGVPPLTFIRRLACVDAQLAPVTDGACAGFHLVPADGYSQHPYERNAPPWLPTGSDGAAMGDLPVLQALLDKLVAMHRLAPGAGSLWLTEQGYESNGQLADRLWTETQQAELNADAEYLAWRDGSIASFSQFLLRDTRTSETLAARQAGNPRALLAGTWTSGLVRENGTPKPALSMFRSPVVARIVSFAPSASWLPSSPAGAPAELLDLWGRARPIRSPTLVVLQVCDDGSGAYRNVGEVTTDTNGIFDVRVAVAAKLDVSVRFAWLAPDGSWQTSPAVPPAVFGTA